MHAVCHFTFQVNDRNVNPSIYHIVYLAVIVIGEDWVTPNNLRLAPRPSTNQGLKYDRGDRDGTSCRRG
jgi:hypothetical protein